MREVRYRTEAFSGTGERDAAEVMAYETFELGNTDILECLEKGLLHDSGALRGRCLDFIDHLNNSGYLSDSVWDEFGYSDGVDFYRQVLAEIKKVTGLDIKYVLWLADKETVFDRNDGYGRDIVDLEDDLDCYEIGPVVLSELGFDGTLYGYPEMPISLEDKVLELKDEMINIINEREADDIDYRRALWLDERYGEVDRLIQEIEDVLSQKTAQPPSLTQQMMKAKTSNITGPGAMESAADLDER